MRASATGVLGLRFSSSCFDDSLVVTSEESSSMGNEKADKKFTWVIKNFSSNLPSEFINSDKFVVGGCKW